MARNKHPEITINRILDVSTQLFMEKGYDNTTIQDIINALGDLSKGAIYHHFQSKEDIFFAIDKRYEAVQRAEFMALYERKDLSGLGKLQYLVCHNLSPEQSGQYDQKHVIFSAPNLLDNPRFLSAQLHDTVEIVAPDILEPLLRQGIADGSIRTEHPKEAAEVLAVLFNVWVNPILWHAGEQVTRDRIAYLSKLLDLMGIPLLDEKTMSAADWMLKL